MVPRLVLYNTIRLDFHNNIMPLIKLPLHQYNVHFFLLFLEYCISDIIKKGHMASQINNTAIAVPTIPSMSVNGTY